MKKSVALYIIAVLLVSSCNQRADEADAWGNFEATEILVSAETSGKIISFPVEEGIVLRENSLLAIIDTTLLSMQLDEMESSEKTINSNIRTITSQNDILRQQISNLEVNISRVRNMLEDQAATQKQYDDLLGQKAVIEKQIESNNSRKAAVASELAVMESRKKQLKEKIARSYILAPSKGTLIQKYAEKGEVTSAGKPLLKIADLSIMKLKVYISGAQLAEIKTGDMCRVRIDKGESEYYNYTGQIINISDKAEFTPKIIQTKEERVSMVYAVTISVENDGRIKSGMPAEVIFGSDG